MTMLTHSNRTTQLERICASLKPLSEHLEWFGLLTVAKQAFGLVWLRALKQTQAY